LRDAKQKLSVRSREAGVISIVHNETLDAIEIYLDSKGADLLIATLEKLKSDGGHLHLYATNDDLGVSTVSPYREKTVYGELVVDILPSEAWESPEA
jgi:hypothetical protein